LFIKFSDALDASNTASFIQLVLCISIPKSLTPYNLVDKIPVSSILVLSYSWLGTFKYILFIVSNFFLNWLMASISFFNYNKTFSCKSTLVVVICSSWFLSLTHNTNKTPATTNTNSFIAQIGYYYKPIGLIIFP
jgi:hypothetical protein